MTPDTFIRNFDLLAEAPGGVPKLRELILQLAVRGKLVSQDPKDEPAGTGLKQIAVPDDIPYTIPQRWRWTTLRSVSHDLGQKVPDKVFTYIDVSAIDKDRGRIDDEARVIRPEDAPSRARKIVNVGTVIYSTVRPYLLNIAVVDREFDPAPIVSTAFFVMHPFACVISRYLFYYLRSQPFTEYVNDAMTGMAYPAVNDSNMSVGPIPLPPLAEQKRIVARVEELMKRCDVLEAWQKERNERRTALTASCLHALTSDTEHRTLNTRKRAIERVCTHFPLLIDTPESVAELRKTILQLAVQGRLVPQDAKEEPASVLLDRIAAARGLRLTRRGTYAASISGHEGTQDLPSGWAWTKLDHAGMVNPRNDADEDLEVGFAPMSAVSQRYGVTPIYERRTWREVKKGFTHFAEGDVGVAKITPCFQNGKSAIFCGLPNGLGAGTTELHVFRPIDGTIVPDYIWIWFKSPRFLSDGEAKMTGSAGQKRVPSSYFAGTPFPLPPLAEQKRIVAKVNELMALCDALEAKLTQSRDDADTLAAAVVQHLCNSGSAHLKEAMA